MTTNTATKSRARSTAKADTDAPMALDASPAADAPAEAPEAVSEAQGTAGHASLAAALAAFQREVPTIRKGNTARVPGKNGATGYSYDYADLSDVTERAMPLLGKHGLSFTARPTLVEGVGFALVYELRHELGESDGGMYPLPSANTPAQQMGSAITYARRYVLTSITGVAPGGDDDDAGAIQQHTYDQQRPQRPQQAQQRPAQQQRPQQAQQAPQAPQDAPQAPAPQDRDWKGEAEACATPAQLTALWEEARGLGAPVPILDGIAAVGRARQEAARAEVAAREASEASAAADAQPVNTAAEANE